jgi:DNA-binding HxlR family transcriptional regulator
MPQSKTFNYPIEAALAVIGGKWKILILSRLHEDVSRFNELRRSIPGISQRMLTQQLRELERDGVVLRRAYVDHLLRVEYGLSDLGRSLGPVMDMLCDWGHHYQETLLHGSPPAAAKEILESA